MLGQTPLSASQMNDLVPFELRSAHITLEALLKASGMAGGGAAKALIAAGAVRVDGQVELRRGRKLRGGEQVQAQGTQLQVLAAPPGADPA
jgi:ribosome-associated protein